LVFNFVLRVVVFAAVYEDVTAVVGNVVVLAAKKVIASRIYHQ